MCHRTTVIFYCHCQNNRLPDNRADSEYHNDYPADDPLGTCFSGIANTGVILFSLPISKSIPSDFSPNISLVGRLTTNNEALTPCLFIIGIIIELLAIATVYEANLNGYQFFSVIMTLSHHFLNLLLRAYMKTIFSAVTGS
jgi:hypothetical protein